MSQAKRSAWVLSCLAGVALAGGCGGDGGAMMMAPGPDVMTFATGDFPVPAGTEVTKCRYLPLPSSTEVAIARFEAHMPPGSHHFNFFFIPPNTFPLPPEGLGDCVDTLRIWLAGSQWTDLDYTMPEGKALKIPKGSWLALESHYVNATTTPKTGNVEVKLHTIPTKDVKDWVGVYFNSMERIRVPAKTQQTLGARCHAYSGTNVFLLTSHMHHFGRAFDIDLVDELSGALSPLYRSDDWAHPVVDDRAASPLVIGDDQGFEWRCHYNNDRSTTLKGGDSAENEEMCIMTALYWPAAPGNSPYCFADATVVP